MNSQRICDTKKQKKTKKQKDDRNSDTFYVVNSGAFDVKIEGIKTGGITTCGYFGELALLYDSPRSATIVVLCYKYKFIQNTFAFFQILFDTHKTNKNKTKIQKKL